MRIDHYTDPYDCKSKKDLKELIRKLKKELERRTKIAENIAHELKLMKSKFPGVLEKLLKEEEKSRKLREPYLRSLLDRYDSYEKAERWVATGKWE